MKSLSPFARAPLLRCLLLACVLLGFARVSWQLDAKNFWWDESLSLQRAELSLWPLLRGELVLKDGFSEMLTIDQHPFFSFLLQAIMVRLAGIDEWVVRFPAAAAATLLTPALWALARRLVQHQVAPTATPGWVALLAAVNPFYLWYGQEARPYALWALLAVVSTYWLVAALASDRWRGRDLALYAATLFAFLATHYLAVFLIPLHGLLVLQRFARHNYRRALTGLGSMTLVGAAAAAIALWQLIRPGAGENLDRITLSVLAADLLNAFSMGLSVNINDVWRLDLLFAALALLGAAWGVRSWRSALDAGWILPLFVLIPMGVLLMINVFRPAYMNARHLSLISGGFLLLVGAGLGVISQWRGWLGILVVLPLLAGAGYSSYNYFTLPQYGKDDFTGMGQFLRERMLPGDVLLINPPSSWRLFAYYLPLAEIDQARANHLPVAYWGVPSLGRSWDERYIQLEQFRQSYRRIWHANSGTHPYFDPYNQVESWLNEHTKQYKRERFFSPNSVVALDLYLPKSPMLTVTPASLPIRHRLDVHFGEQIHLAGYDLGPPLAPGFATPITLYWQALTKSTQPTKYILRLVEITSDWQWNELAITEREPYDGLLPVTVWEPGQTVVEYSELPPLKPLSGQGDSRFELIMQMYDVASQVKLPVQLRAGDAAVPDAETLVLPFAAPSDQWAGVSRQHAVNRSPIGR
jgi:hypothetical protein